MMAVGLGDRYYPPAAAARSKRQTSPTHSTLRSVLCILRGAKISYSFEFIQNFS